VRCGTSEFESSNFVTHGEPQFSVVPSQSSGLEPPILSGN